MQLKRGREDINAAKLNLGESRDANEWYFNHIANRESDDLQLATLPHLYKTIIELSDGSQLDARWRELFQITDMTQSLGTSWLAELDGV
jgi:hypothetical protein